MSIEPYSVTDMFRLSLQLPLEDLRYEARQHRGSRFLDPSDSDRLQIYEKIARLRREQYEASGPLAFLAPVDRKPRWCIPETSWKPPEDISKGLLEIDPSLEIIHDPLTHPPNTAPEHGCHLYRKEKWKGFDFLILEISLMWNVEEAWPKGRPRAPGMWLVRWVKEHDKAKMPGDREHIDHQVCVNKIESSIKDKMAVHKKDMEAAAMLHDVIDKKWNLDRVQDSPFMSIKEEDCGENKADAGDLPRELP